MNISLRVVVGFVIGVMALVILIGMTQSQVGGLEDFIAGAV